MLILGAGGFARQLLSIVLRNPAWGMPIFFDDINPGEQLVLKRDFRVLRSWQEVEAHFGKHPHYVLGTGGAEIRRQMAEKADSIGGKTRSLVSDQAIVSDHHTQIGDGVTILDGCVVECYATIGKGALLNLHSSVTHDCTIGDFAELGPYVCILGRATVGQMATIGAGAIVKPGINVGDHAIVGAGAVVTKDVPSHATVTGIPARAR